MTYGFWSAGTSFATGLPCFVISTLSLFACTSSMTARQCILKEPAAILFILELRDHSHYTMVIFANQNELVSQIDLIDFRKGSDTSHDYPIQQTILVCVSNSCPKPKAGVRLPWH